MQTQDLILTGCNGFLGAHILLEWLTKYPNSNILCMLHEDDIIEDKNRIKTSLERAINESGRQINHHIFDEQITPVLYDCSSISINSHNILNKRLQNTQSCKIIHSASNLSFSDAEKDLVWQVNVVGTQNLLDLVNKYDQIKCFNYISTAYLADETDGNIYEENIPTIAFKNIYEQSKWETQKNIIQQLSAKKLAYRIFRPSIIIAHSKTYKMTLLRKNVHNLRIKHQQKYNLTIAELCRLTHIFLEQYNNKTNINEIKSKLPLENLSNIMSQNNIQDTIVM